jgi:hypothetical protein
MNVNAFVVIPGLPTFLFLYGIVQSTFLVGFSKLFMVPYVEGDDTLLYTFAGMGLVLGMVFTGSLIRMRRRRADETVPF